MLKALIEQRNALAEQANKLVDAAATEVRALTDDEKAKHSDLEEQIRALDETIEKARSAIEPADYTLVDDAEPERRTQETADEVEKREIAEFATFIRNAATDGQDMALRAAANLDMGNNGAIIPKTIANMIIKQVVDMSPIYAATTKYPVKGTLAIPYYDETSDRVTVAWAEEFKTLESHSGKFTSIELSGHLAAALTKISKSLMNNSDSGDLVTFIVNDMAEKVALFLEEKLLHVGEDEKVDGLKGVKLVTTAAGQAVVTSDELIALQDSIKDRFQGKCAWIMNSKTRTYIRQLKDQEGRYMLQGGDITTGFGSTLLGKPIWVSDAMPDMAADKIAIYYGDYSGLAVQNIESPEIEILRELFALEHAVGANVWFEFDSKVQDAQKIACLKMAAGD